PDPAPDRAPRRAEEPLESPLRLEEELFESPAQLEREVTAEQVSLARRLRQPRTIISLVLPPILLVLIFRIVLSVDFAELVQAVLAANPVLLLAAVLVYYLGFPLRGYRWVLLLRGAGSRIRLVDGTHILFLSWFVNCLVPAKLGDVYRAYLLKENAPVSLSRTFGTVFIERILDLFVIAMLGLAAGFWSFRSGLPPSMQFVVALGVGVMIALGLGLLMMRSYGRRILARLPVPSRVMDLYDRFEEGVFGSIGVRALPGLFLLTGIIWMTEALRLYFVVEALGFPDVQLGISGAAFVALVGSLLTAVPLSPAGIGVVELGVVGVLTAAYGIPLQEATTIALVDRAISVFSIIVLGAVVYAVSPVRRGRGIPCVETAPAAAAAGAAPAP
ncbi:MAG: flippase-like domain-containing protein, partial [Chloroflexi bacterium]|nr:flippase-like domain-containing protein [Chloroflexota bacterium]